MREGSLSLSADKEKGLFSVEKSRAARFTSSAYPHFLLPFFSHFFRFCSFSSPTPSSGKGEGEGSGMMMVVVPLLVINKQWLTTLFKIPSHPLSVSLLPPSTRGIHKQHKKMRAAKLTQKGMSKNEARRNSA